MTRRPGTFTRPYRIPLRCRSVHVDRNVRTEGASAVSAEDAPFARSHVRPSRRSGALGRLDSCPGAHCRERDPPALRGQGREAARNNSAARICALRRAGGPATRADGALSVARIPSGMSSEETTFVFGLYPSGDAALAGNRAGSPCGASCQPALRAASSMAASMLPKFVLSIRSITGPVSRPIGPPLGTYR